jgi:hypothetical protein
VIGRDLDIQGMFEQATTYLFEARLKAKTRAPARSVIHRRISAIRAASVFGRGTLVIDLQEGLQDQPSKGQALSVLRGLNRLVYWRMAADPTARACWATPIGDLVSLVMPR